MNKIENINSILFIGLFVLQQMVSFMFANADLVTPYWLGIYCIVFVLAFNLPILSKEFKKERIFTIILIFSMFPMLIKGDFPQMIQFSLFWVIGYVGFVFINTRKINIKFFDFVFIALYIYFYFIYFRYKELLVNIDNEGDLFGHSSSNTMAMTLNMLMFFYYYLSKHYYKVNVINRLLVFSLLNVILIIIQGSRAGLVVALMFLIILVAENFSKLSKKMRIVLTIFGTIGIIYTIYTNIEYISFYMIENGMIRDSGEFETEVRSLAIADFFFSLNLDRFLCGYPFGHVFAFRLTRTFNCYLDIWCYYGFFTFLIILFLIIRRAFRHKLYYDSLWLFVPILAYGIYESFMANGLWQIFWYFMFFQFKKIDYETKSIKKLGQKSH